MTSTTTAARTEPELHLFTVITEDGGRKAQKAPHKEAALILHLADLKETTERLTLNPKEIVRNFPVAVRHETAICKACGAEELGSVDDLF